MVTVLWLVPETGVGAVTGESVTLDHCTRGGFAPRSSPSHQRCLRRSLVEYLGDRGLLRPRRVVTVPDGAGLPGVVTSAPRRFTALKSSSQFPAQSG
jgi:hypothetical protein